MSVQVANLNISGFAVGQGSKITFGNALPPPTIAQQMNAAANISANLFLFNESGSGLRCTLPVSGESFTLAAGQWRIVLIPPNEQELDFTVLYVLANAPVTQLLADLYLPGETIDAIGVLGNSPIGLSGVTALTTKIPINTTGGSVVGIEFGPDTHTGSDWEFDENSTGDFFLWDNQTPRVIWLARRSDGAMLFGNTNMSIISNAGVLTQVAGQATAGTFGVPPIVAEIQDALVNVTASINALVFAPAADGYYEVSAYAVTGGTGTAALVFGVSYTNRASTAVSVHFSAEVTGTTPTLLTGAQGAQAQPKEYACTTISFFAKSSGNITVFYQNNATTANDHVSAAIKRLG